MKQSLRLSIATLFVLLLPVLGFLFVPRLNGFSTQQVKESLRKEGVYAQLSVTLQQQLAPHGDVSPEQGLTDLIRQQLTPSYIQTKTEMTLDKVTDYTVGKTQTPPSLDFNDLHQQFSLDPKTNTTMQQAIAQLQQQLQNQQGQLSTSDQQSANQYIQQAETVNKLAKGDWTISFGDNLKALPLAYRVYVWGWWGLLAFLLLLLSVFVWLEPKWRDRCRGLGVVVLLAGLWNGILFVVFRWLAFDLGPNIIKQQLDGMQGLPTTMILGLLTDLENRLLLHYVAFEIGLTVALVVMGAGLVVGSRFIEGSVKTNMLSAQPEAPESEVAAMPAESLVAK